MHESGKPVKIPVPLLPQCPKGRYIGPYASRSGIQSYSLCLIRRVAGSVVMTRTAARREWLPVGVVCPILGDLENGAGKRRWGSYQDPTQVSQGEKPKAYRGTVGEGTRQISHVR